MSTDISAELTEPIMIEISDKSILFYYSFINVKDRFVYRRKVTVLV
jgi:hypothetical protein